MAQSHGRAESAEQRRGLAACLLGLCQERAQSFRSRLCLEEASGSLGDLGTLIPLLAACAKLGTIRMGPAIFWMGIFNVVSALQWDIPMPVQPMKSIAAVAIADGMTPGAFAAAGILVGGIMMVLGLTGTIDVANRLVPGSVIAGMQVGLGVKMAAQGCGYWHDHGWLDGVDSKLTALLCFLATVVLMLRTKLPTALVVFMGGVALTITRMFLQGTDLEFGLMSLEVIVPSGKDWLDGFVQGALPQLPLTTLNSVISVCALSVTLFGAPEQGGKGATRVSVASSVGIMNLVGCWFGGMPSCHGAGGLAGQYKFGARGGAAVLLLGAVKIAVAVSFGRTLDAVILCFPKAVLGVLLLFAGVELASVGTRSLKASDEADLLPCFVTAGAYIGMKNMALGAATGLFVAAVQKASTWQEVLARLSPAHDDLQGKTQAPGCEGCWTEGSSSRTPSTASEDLQPAERAAEEPRHGAGLASLAL